MKNYILIILLMTAFHGYSKEKKPDPKDVKIDSLKRVNDSLKVKLDSVSKDLKIYYGLYNTIKDKILKNDFDPSRFSEIIDSLKAKRDSDFALRSNATETKDSLSYINSEKYKLKEANEDDVKKNKIYFELKQLKELLDDKILTFTEFDDLKKKLLDKW